MHIAYKRLFRIRIGHDWYPDGNVRTGDVAVVPTPSTAMLLAALGVRARAEAGGLTVYAEVEPGSLPPVMRRPLGPTSLRLAFELRWNNAPLLGITDLGSHRPARTIFCFDNLRADAAPGRLHLGDRLADARIGRPVALVTGPTYHHVLGSPAARATLTVRDRFGTTVAVTIAQSPQPPTPIVEDGVDLRGLPPGRYEISDDRGGRAAIYYDRGLAASRPLGVIEIFTRTDGVTPNGSDEVPAAYRFVSGDAVNAIDPYRIQLPTVASTWRYIVTKKYTSSTVGLDALAIDGPVAFTRAVAPPRAVFTSTGTVRLAEARRGLTLMEEEDSGRTELRELPDPDLTTPLGSPSAGSALVSDVYVYV